MSKTALGMSRPTLVQVINGGAVLFGVAGVMAPGTLGAAYSVPPSPHTTQLLRLFGSRMLALAALGYTTRSKEETDRALAVGSAMNILDALIALTAGTGRTAVRAAATSAAFGALGLVVRSLED